MVNLNHPRTKKNRKRRRKDRLSGDVVPPTEFWIGENGEHTNSDSSYADVSLSPVIRDHTPLSEVIGEANRVLDEGINMETQHQVASTPSGLNPIPLDDRSVEAIATKVQEKMMVQFTALSTELTNTLGGRIKNLEETVQRLDTENKQLKADIRALSVAGMDPQNASTIVDMVKEKVEEVLNEKQVLCRKTYSYDHTVVAIGVTELPGEDPRKVAETLLRDGLRLPHLIDNIVRTCRLPFNTKTGKSGHIKIEFENEESRKQVIAVTGRLKGYTAMGRKIIVRGSQPQDTRMMVGNMHALIAAAKLNNDVFVTPHGSVRPLTYQQNQQQFQYRQQPVQQWGQQPMNQTASPLLTQNVQPQIAQPGEMTNQFSYTVPPTASHPPMVPQMGQPMRPHSAPNYVAQSAPNYAPSYANAVQGNQHTGPSAMPSQMTAPRPPPPNPSVAQVLQNSINAMQG